MAGAATGPDDDNANDSDRLDLVLVARGLAATRARARDAIRRACVRVDGRLVTRPGQTVRAGSDIAVDDPLAGYVSRAAAKLAAGLDAFGYAVAGRRALDVGASTGGFTQVLLERGAERVVAVDVGRDQLAEALRRDPRVTSLEGLNARDLAAHHLGGPVDALVADASFISLRLALRPALGLAETGSWAVVLVKPQFEVGRQALGKGGVVRDPEVAEQAARDIAGWLAAEAGWSVDGIVPSPLAGGDGNREFLLGARKDG